MTNRPHEGDKINYIRLDGEHTVVESVDSTVQEIFNYLRDYEGSHGTVIFCAVELDHKGEPQMIRSYAAGEGPDLDYLLLELARIHRARP